MKRNLRQKGGKGLGANDEKNETGGGQIVSSCCLSPLLSTRKWASAASYKSGRGVGKNQSILPFIECSVRRSHCNSIQTAQ